MFVVHLNVFRWNLGDCTNGGVSAANERLALYSSGTDTPKPEHAANAVYVDRNAFGDPIIVPLAGGPAGSVGPMMGGNYAATSDSRLSELVEKVTGRRFYGALPIHDRYETVAQYRALST